MRTFLLGLFFLSFCAAEDRLIQLPESPGGPMEMLREVRGQFPKEQVKNIYNLLPSIQDERGVKMNAENSKKLTGPFFLSLDAQSDPKGAQEILNAEAAAALVKPVASRALLVAEPKEASAAQDQGSSFSEQATPADSIIIIKVPECPAGQTFVLVEVLSKGGLLVRCQKESRSYAKASVGSLGLWSVNTYSYFPILVLLFVVGLCVVRHFGLEESLNKLGRCWPALQGGSQGP